MGQMETETIISRLVGLRRSIAAAAVAAILGSAAPAFAQYHVPSPPSPKGAVIQKVVWRWTGYRWVWVPGPRYLPPPRPHWIPGHWVRRPRGWFWAAGHWG
jgi:hypothetical protein